MTGPQATLLRGVILRLNELHPEDVDKQTESCLQVLAYAIENKLLDEPTLATLRAQGTRWPESIRVLLGAL